MLPFRKFLARFSETCVIIPCKQWAASRSSFGRAGRTVWKEPRRADLRSHSNRHRPRWRCCRALRRSLHGHPTPTRRGDDPSATTL